MQIILDVSEFQSVAQLDAVLHSADDEIVGVYIKATQSLDYRDHVASTFAAVCQKHDTPFGYYDFLGNDAPAGQAAFFSDFVAMLPEAALIPMLDCEAPYSLGVAGINGFRAALDKPVVVYASTSAVQVFGYRSIMPQTKLWVAQYNRNGYYRPSDGEIASYKALGYTAWQWTSNYMGHNQDASVLLSSLDDLRA